MCDGSVAAQCDDLLECVHGIERLGNKRRHIDECAVHHVELEYVVVRRVYRVACVCGCDPHFVCIERGAQCCDADKLRCGVRVRVAVGAVFVDIL